MDHSGLYSPGIDAVFALMVREGGGDDPFATAATVSGLIVPALYLVAAEVLSEGGFSPDTVGFTTAVKDRWTSRIASAVFIAEQGGERLRPGFIKAIERAGCRQMDEIRFTEALGLTVVDGGASG